ncbi:MAG TPA: hypothetical protein VE130_05895 [Nitrososphaeraceae archaeon]|jgi:hypothetical protein|nr:hypothetical protein [Nitrososphaeraceae archaeon]
MPSTLIEAQMRSDKKRGATASLAQTNRQVSQGSPTFGTGEAPERFPRSGSKSKKSILGVSFH